MNRKNLTAAVLAGLAGVAGMAGAAQAAAHTAAVNMNPDGLGDVLIYPYYTTDGDNTTLLTVVNTTGDAKAVKVRFLEGYNSREVLDFNLYMSEYDVWVAAISDSATFGAEAGVPHLFIPDTSCTVPYLYEDAYNETFGGGLQAFLPYAFTGEYADGGPSTIARASQGYVEMIEMGVMVGDDDGSKRIDSETAVTHVLVENDDGDEVSMPEDCSILVRNWTFYEPGFDRDHPMDGMWMDEALAECTEDDPRDVDRLELGTGGIPGCGQSDNLDSLESTGGGLFGGAAIYSVGKGTMYSYDAKALQGFDTTADGIHYYPGTIHPSLNDGSTTNAIVFLGGGMTQTLAYPDGVGAVSALFMHDELANTFVISEGAQVATEWVMTMPTKAWYVDATLLNGDVWYTPDPLDDGCNGWDVGEINPYIPPQYTTGSATGLYAGGWLPGDDAPTYQGLDWTLCTPLKQSNTEARPPFTDLFDGQSCEVVSFKSWDREESPFEEEFGYIPPIVSPAPPIPPTPGETPFELCYEVNVLRFGDRTVFDGDLIADGGLVYTVTGTPDAGWARINMEDDDHEDENGLQGLPITGFSAEQYTNGDLDGVRANYGGLFQHKGSVCLIPDSAPAGTDCDSARSF